MPLGAPSNSPKVDPVKAARGQMAHASGAACEDQVRRWYEKRGATCLETRWRGQGGEIDLIFRAGDDIVFVEVKSSRTHGRAADLLNKRQIARLCAAAEEYLGTLPTGSLTPMRMDVALVDAQGHIDVLENALMAV